MFSVLKTFLRRAGAELPEDRVIRGLPVTLINTRPDIDSEHVFARLDAALALIEQYQPWHFRRLPRDFARIQVRRFPCRGAYFPDTRICLVELTFIVNPDFTPTQVAATILHEAMHARLDNAGVKYETTSAAKHERFCRRAEVEFGMAAPDGGPVVDRALASLEITDEEVAPVIDWEIAGRRVEEADLAALKALDAPDWMKRAIAGRGARPSK
ncbi:MAG TPA: hypothetical protein VJW73_21100 [Gemmatimonadaceae bacterium]|nr:hypothetical protein [Gemmatimonadaceae bacterium]